MKKTYKRIIGVFLSFVIAIFLTSCMEKSKTPTEDIHECNYERLEFDESSHWHTCECGKSDVHVLHEFGEGEINEEQTKIKYTCEECGYTFQETYVVEHECDFSHWDYSTTRHWQVCECGKKTTLASHEFDKGSIDKEKMLITYTCAVCGYQKQTKYVEEHICEFTNWLYSKEYHWQECSCGKTNSRSLHIFGDGKVDLDNMTVTYTCSYCSYSYQEVYVEEHECDFNTLKYNDTHHWNECSCGEKTALTSHEFDNGVVDGDKITYTCTTCEYKKVLDYQEEHECDFNTLKYNDTHHWNECDCGEKDSLVAHQFDNGVVNGSIKTFTCSCGYEKTEEIHICEFDILEKDDTFHWNKCSCGELTTKEEHLYDGGVSEGNNIKYTCIECNYEYIVDNTPEHTHAYDLLAKNSTHHWQECLCGEITEKEEHQFDAGVIEDNKITYTCEICEYKKVLDYVEEHECVYSSWQYTSSYHWQECSCGNVTERSQHQFDSGRVLGTTITFTCLDCEYSYSQRYEQTHIHQFKGEYLSDENGHWQVCSCDEASTVEEHNFDSGRETETHIIYTCITCKYEKQEQIHVCEYDRWVYSSTYHWQQCLCGAVTERSKHDLDNGVVTVNPTENSTGLKVYTCSKCSYSYEEVLPTLSHTHIFAEDDWYYDAYSHWLECECGEVSEEEAHQWDNGTVIVKATCKNGGQTRYSCLICGNEKLVQTEKANHSFIESYMFDNYYHWYECENCGEVSEEDVHHYDSGRVISKATCSKEGKMEYACLDCGKTKQEAIAKIEHTYSEYSFDNQYHWYECENCGNVHEITEHKWNSGETEVVATCTTAGSIKYTCTDCGKYKVEEIEKLPHSYQDEWLKDSSNHWHKCQNCDNKSSVLLHDFDEGVIITTPTEDVEGLKRYTCQTCEYVKDEVLGVIEHTHTFEDVYTFDEYNHWYASTCGHDIKQYEEAHEWNRGSITTAPTCHSVGIKTYECYYCDATKTEEISMTSHTYSDEWLADNIGHWHKCINCDSVTEKITHNWNSGKITVEATEYAEGEILYTCIDCSHTKTEAIPMLDHDHVFGVEYKNDETHHWHECRCAEKSDIEAHKFGNGVVVTKATCSTEGLMRYTCSTCQYVKEEKIATLAHTYGDVWFSDYKYHWHECTICGAVEKYIAHTVSSPTTIVKATTKQEGVTLATCTTCEAESYGTLDRLTETREARSTSTKAVSPTNISLEPTFDPAADGYVYKSGNDLYMKSSGYSMRFVYSSGKYKVEFLDANGTKRFQMNKPAIVYVCVKIGSAAEKLSGLYDSVTTMEYGVKAIATLTSANGTVFRIEDKYYYPSNTFVENAINVERSVIIQTSTSSIKDYGYESVFVIESVDGTTSDIEWFVPNSVFGDIGSAYANKSRSFTETKIGLPIALMRDGSSGYSISLARYQPIIDLSNSYYASVSIYEGTTSLGSSLSSLECEYPSAEGQRKYFTFSKNMQVVYDMSIMMFNNSSIDGDMIDSYKNQYDLENVRIVDTDIDEVYKVINQDFNTFLGSYNGLPWTVTIENGHYGSRSYQAGFVGQQIPAAYNMMLYGAKYGNTTIYNKGKSIINWWVNSGMSNSCGLPKIWRTESGWSNYPIFTRMAIDAMEGMLDAYRLEKARGTNNSSWYNTIIACANFYANNQNSDGSWYRCYNHSGGVQSEYYNEGSTVNLAQGYSKDNTTMPVRFLGKIYELTGDTKYLNAVKKAGTYIYNNLYTQHCYYGGTCDNPNSMDKEAGVYAMYAYDTLYMLTEEAKWLTALEQATIFTMSSVLTVSYRIPTDASTLKAAKPLQYGYTDGLSHILCNGSSVDNYAAYIYYELFRLYILTGESVYFDMAEFIQQNTKSTMDWDGVLGYYYKSLVPEASIIWGGSYQSAKDDQNLQGVWLPWQSVANAEPIAKMYDTFGSGDVLTYKNSSLSSLRSTLNSYGVGGKAHRKY